jgi:F-type H+-transporting ATPase subunit gamma
MPSLRDYRDRITSVKSTRKITSAMKMVAAAKLKKAQNAAEKAQPYAKAMAAMMARVAGGVTISPASPKLLIGSGADKKHLLIVMSSDRGLCGGFNANIIRFARNEILKLQRAGKDVQIMTVGRKARDVLKRDFASLILKSFTGIGGKDKVSFAEVNEVAGYMLSLYDENKFDVCHLVYNEFKSVLAQPPKIQQLVPFSLPEKPLNDDTVNTLTSPYDFEPEEEALLGELLPKNISMQMYRALLDSAAGEQAARMTAMDNATRNAGDMIKSLSLKYNRARQAYITKELIEIISGAEAV